jgi:aryl-alcohol dehydrogenase-like predicted oxidoreductase
MLWGNTLVDRFVNGRVVDADTLREIVAVASSAGVTFYDTAEGYGGGTSETRLKNAVTAAGEVPSALCLSSKFLPTLWRWSEKSFLSSLDESNKRLGIPCSPLFFIHSPIHPLGLKHWVRAAGAAYRQGKLRALGLSNCNAKQVCEAVDEAKKSGVPIVANQILFNLLVSNSPAVRETLEACRFHGITVVAYSPLGQGLLADKLDEKKAAEIRMSRVTNLRFSDLVGLRRVMEDISTAHGKPMSQVAMNYVRAKGAVPLVGVRTVFQMREALDALSWSLAPDEVQALDRAALDRHTFERGPIRRALFLTLITGLVTVSRMSAWLFGLVGP